MEPRTGVKELSLSSAPVAVDLNHVMMVSVQLVVDGSQCVTSAVVGGTGGRGHKMDIRRTGQSPGSRWAAGTRLVFVASGITIHQCSRLLAEEGESLVREERGSRVHNVVVADCHGVVGVNSPLDDAQVGNNGSSSREQWD